MSDGYWWRPVTKSRPSTFLARAATCQRVASAIVGGVAPIVCASGLPVGQLAVARSIARRPVTTRPSSAPTSTGLDAASARPPCRSASARAAAAARRSCGAMVGVVRLRTCPCRTACAPCRAMTIVDAADRDAQLVGDRLRQRRADVLAELRFPGEHVDAPSARTWIHAAMSPGTSSEAPPARRPDSCPAASTDTATKRPAPTSFNAVRRSTSK